MICQRDPLREYQSEAFELFHAMLANLRETVTRVLSLIEVRADGTEDLLPRQQAVPMQESRRDPAMALVGGQPDAADTRAAPPTARASAAPVRRAPPPGVSLDPGDPETWGKVPRNAACPCGSGRKYKHCHGALSETAAS